MKMSPEVSELAKALVEFQKVKKVAVFDSEASATQTRKYKYASLGSVDEAAKAMTEYGLSYSMFPISDGWYIGVDAVLLHESGQWLSERFLFPMNTEAYNPAQEAGKIITYARRYALSAILGITADEDVDGVLHEQKTAQDKKAPSKSSAEVDKLIEEYWKPIARQAEEYGIPVDPLPPNPTEEEVKKSYLALQDAIERKE